MQRLLLYIILPAIWFCACPAIAQERVLQFRPPPPAAPPPSPEVDTCKKCDVFQKIEHFARKETWASKLLRSVMIIPKNHAPADTTKVSEAHYAGANGKIIRNIDIMVLGPFGYSVSEKFSRPINMFQRLGDQVHYPTRHWVIYQKLLFKPGDRIEPLKISESERLIRQAPYVVDARVYLTAVPAAPDSIDAMVVVQDVFNFSGSAAANPATSSGDLSLTDINFLGLGQRFSNRARFGDPYGPALKYDGSYSVDQIANTYISGEAHLNTDYYNERTGFSFSRPFFSTLTSWAGGLDIEYARQSFATQLPDRTLFLGRHRSATQDAWLGYSFSPTENPFSSIYNSRIIISGRVYNIIYPDENKTPDNLNLIFPSETQYLAAIAFNRREYYKDHYIFAFGKTEDIPLGYLISINAGPDITAYYQRFYYGVSASYGWNISSAGYFNIGAEAGGYLHNKDIEQGVLNTRFLYFTPLFNIGKQWQLRQYIQNRLTLGLNRKPGEVLTINGASGLQQFASPAVAGTKRWVNNYEADFYSPWNPLGFRMVFVLYADQAFISGSSTDLLQSRLYQGYGIGLRFKNEHFIFNTLELAFHFFPDESEYGTAPWRYSSTEHSNYQFQGFQFSEPYTASFQ